MKDILITKDFSSKLNNPSFYDKVYHTLKEHGNEINYGEYCAKILANGCIKVLKSLDLYKVSGKGETKKTYMNDFVLLIYNTTVADNKTISESIIKLYDGTYCGINNIKIKDYTKYDLLSTDYPFNINSTKSTYILYNPSNNLYKIGKARDVFKRLNKIKKEVNIDVEIIGWNGYDIEHKLHKEYMIKRVFGEWFSINTDDILDIKNTHNFNIVKLIEFSPK